MSLPWIVALACIFGLLLLIFLVKRNSAGEDLDELAQQVRPIDVDAFLNLISATERDYLRRHLPPGEFRRIHRERMLAAIAYAWAAAEQARILNRVAEIALRDSNPEVVATAADLQRHAIRVRLRALQLIPRFALEVAVPSFGPKTDTVARTCDELTWNLAALARLKSPRAEVINAA